MRVIYLPGTAPPLIIQRREHRRRQAGYLLAAAQGPVYVGAGEVLAYALGPLSYPFALGGLLALTAGVSLAIANVLIIHRLDEQVRIR